MKKIPKSVLLLAAAIMMIGGRTHAAGGKAGKVLRPAVTDQLKRAVEGNGLANDAPVAENLQLKDPVQIGQTISIYYDYTDADADVEGTTRFAWYRSSDRTFDAGDTAIVGATQRTYTLQATDRLHYLFCRVTPVAVSGVLEGTAVVSEPSERVGGIAVTSSAFRHNAYIPVEHAFFNGNVSIPLQWTDVGGAAYYNLRFYDRDDLDYVHWSVDTIPASTLSLAAGADLPEGAVVNTNSLNEAEYTGVVSPDTARFVAVISAHDAGGTLLDVGSLTGLFSRKRLLDLAPVPTGNTVDYDFAYRDLIPQTDENKHQWADTWGPYEHIHPSFAVPDFVDDPITFKRNRAVAIARKYLGVPYRHKHIPALGLDCSNFTAWVYNYGFGNNFTSAVGAQADQAGRRLDPDEPLEPGDLMFIANSDGTGISHVVMYIGGGASDEVMVIHSNDGRVHIADLNDVYWLRTRYSHARRIFETGVAPQPAFSYAQKSPSTPLTYQFDATSSTDSDGTIVRYDWDFGDGTTAIGPTPEHTFPAGADYTVTLRVCDDDRYKANVSYVVHVKSSAKRPFYVAPSSGGGCAIGATAGNLLPLLITLGIAFVLRRRRR